MPNVSVAVHRGAMFMAHVAYVKDGMLQQETVFVRGLSQNGAEQAIAAYVEGLYSPSDFGVRTITPVVTLPGACTLIMPDESERPPAEPQLSARRTPILPWEFVRMERGVMLLLPCRIERTAFTSERLVTVRGNEWEFIHDHLLDEDRDPLASTIPPKGITMNGFLKVRWLRQDGKHSMVELPNGCCFDCVEGELVRL